MSSIHVTNVKDASGNAALVTESGGVKTDKLTGITTAGSISVVGEGNSTTTNLQQGLAKTFVSATLAAVIYDSFNISSSEDEGTGDYKYGVTNALAISTAREGAAGCALGYQATFRLKTADATTAVIDIEMVNASFSVSNADHSCVIHGDLA